MILIEIIRAVFDKPPVLYHMGTYTTIAYLSIYIYKIKVLSVHWNESRQILVAHVSSKVMNENTRKKISVCLSVCLSVCVFAWFPRIVAHDSRKNGLMDYYEISYLDQMSSNLRF